MASTHTPRWLVERVTPPKVNAKLSCVATLLRKLCAENYEIRKGSRKFSTAIQNRQGVGFKVLCFNFRFCFKRVVRRKNTFVERCEGVRAARQVGRRLWKESKRSTCNFTTCFNFVALFLKLKGVPTAAARLGCLHPSSIDAHANNCCRFAMLSKNFKH